MAPKTVAISLGFSALLIISIFLSMTWAARAQPVVPCQAPLQWEGRTVEYDHSSGRNILAMVSYDSPHQRLRVLEEKKRFIPCKKFFEYIYLYKDAVMYQIEQLTKLCSKISLSEPWDPYDIPDNSTYEDQYYIGGPSDQIMVQEWSDRKPARKLENWVGVYTVKDCYPVQETYTKNYSVTTSTRFFDLKLGISDPSVFIPPSTCQTAQSEKMTYEKNAPTVYQSSRQILLCVWFFYTKRPITHDIKIMYQMYFNCPLGDQDKSWAPHVICSSCSNGLRDWLNMRKVAMPFAVPMIWREPKNHSDDCYVCFVKLKGFSTKNKHKINYSELESAIRPVPHDDTLPVSVPPLSGLDEIEVQYGAKATSKDMKVKMSMYLLEQPSSQNALFNMN